MTDETRGDSGTRIEPVDVAVAAVGDDSGSTPWPGSPSRATRR